MKLLKLELGKDEHSWLVWVSSSIPMGEWPFWGHKITKMSNHRLTWHSSLLAHYLINFLFKMGRCLFVCLFIVKKGRPTQAVPHLDVFGVLEAWLCYVLLKMDLENLFGDSIRGAELTQRPIPLYWGRLSSSTRHAVWGKAMWTRERYKEQVERV